MRAMTTMNHIFTKRNIGEGNLLAQSISET